MSARSSAAWVWRGTGWTAFGAGRWGRGRRGTDCIGTFENRTIWEVFVIGVGEHSAILLTPPLRMCNLQRRRGNDDVCVRRLDRPTDRLDVGGSGDQDGRRMFSRPESRRGGESWAAHRGQTVANHAPLATSFILPYYLPTVEPVNKRHSACAISTQPFPRRLSQRHRPMRRPSTTRSMPKPPPAFSIAAAPLPIIHFASQRPDTA